MHEVCRPAPQFCAHQGQRFFVLDAAVPYYMMASSLGFNMKAGVQPIMSPFLPEGRRNLQRAWTPSWGLPSAYGPLKKPHMIVRCTSWWAGARRANMGELYLLPAPKLAVLAGSLLSGAIIYIMGIGRSHKLELFRLSSPSPPSESIIKCTLLATDDSCGVNWGTGHGWLERWGEMLLVV